MAVEFLNIEPHTDAWYSYRKENGTGASEVATIMNLNPYECPLQLFHRKLNLLPRAKKNIRMELGNMSENLIGELYEYYDKDEAVFLDNLDKKRKVRKVEPSGGICINSDYKGLFVSLDRKCFEDGKWIDLEFKNKTYQSYKQYENAMNPAEIVQLSTQLIVSRFPIARIIYLIDNVRLEVFELKLEDALRLENKIIRAYKYFNDRVDKGRILLNRIYEAKNQFNQKLVEKLHQELYALEPPSDNSEAYLSYLTELAKTRRESHPLKGNPELLSRAKELQKIQDKRKKLEAQEVAIKSELVTVLRENEKSILDFGKEGNLSFHNGRFSLKLK